MVAAKALGDGSTRSPEGGQPLSRPRQSGKLALPGVDSPDLALDVGVLHRPRRHRARLRHQYTPDPQHTTVSAVAWRGNCHKMRGRNGTVHRYYYCRNHDLLRAGARTNAAPSATELDEYVFAQVRQALLDPRALIAGEHAVITGTPIDENELIANQIKRITNAVTAAELEWTRLLDAYQAGLVELDELTRRPAAITTKRDQLQAERDTLTERNAELATENRLRRGLASFAERIAASLDALDPDARQRLMRLVIEKVRVTGWRVEIHLKIPLADDGPDNHDPPSGPTPEPGPSSDMGLRSHREAQRRQLPPARQRPRRPPDSARLLTLLRTSDCQPQTSSLSKDKLRKSTTSPAAQPPARERPPA